MSPLTLPTPLVTVGWLAEHLGARGLRVVDCSAFLPTSDRNARAEYQEGHIPGAVFADMEWLHDESSSLPHTFPSEAQFAECMGQLGVGNDDAVVAYDSSGQNFSAPRLWFMLRAFGHARVAVLDGGLLRWKLEGYALESGSATVSPAHFVARLDRTRLRDISAMRDNIASANEQVVDARSAGRFAATEPEPRAGIRGGHIPGSRSLPYARLVREDGTLRAPDELRTIIADAGLDTSRPVVAACGSGLTACAIVLALEAIGAREAAVYDGSWTEWGGRTDTPVETGPPR